MSAPSAGLSAPRPSMRPMREADVEAVMEIELRAYPFPWTAGIFRDCLRAGYQAWVLQDADAVCGYGVVSVAAGEAHLLNICVDPRLHGHGHGRRLLRALLKIAHEQGAERMYLEVRPSNAHAVALYHDEGFNEIGRRPRYYPDHEGREDALVMARELFGD